MPALIRSIRLVHPFPSLVNAALVLGLAQIAGGTPPRAAALALGMLGLQFCIGSVNDIIDERLDARAKPWKPIPSGLVSRRTALIVAIVSGSAGLLLATAAGPAVVLLALVMLGCGLAYDLYLKPTVLAWACFALAFMLLPIYAWYGAVGTLPPRAELLIPLAALAGPLILLSNGLSDLEIDRAAGLETLAVRLGRRGSLLAIVAMLAVLHGLAWITVSRAASPGALAVAAGASACAVAGLMLSASDSRDRRELGWMVQAGSIALLGLGWLAAAT